jgi:hypothetical protein
MVTKSGYQPSNKDCGGGDDDDDNYTSKLQGK